ncbi:DUF3073 domain-containing protein [Galactobacter caseinivorans]|uniref:DUF3073 domain-containing protein n=1 Tax=Galactobacter caseinivorans TaxID=2676123 RepID=A0A496PLA0_9MICC|nr:DUF3073 domain-containing protein [Galactobacter caseinivorans]RKW71305.1 DUF3073 domain-containing protein [Galactobacter caseinivorans]
MGRGRQKAKATRQAREMKYYSPGTDLHALERELGGIHDLPSVPSDREEETYDDDPYADYDKKYAGEDEDEAKHG